MFNNLFGTWGSNEDHYYNQYGSGGRRPAGKGGQQQQQQQQQELLLRHVNYSSNILNHTKTRDLSSLIRDEEEKDLEDTVQDLDELADRLLTQFPAYGSSNSSNSNNNSNSNSNINSSPKHNSYYSYTTGGVIGGVGGGTKPRNVDDWFSRGRGVTGVRVEEEDYDHDYQDNDDDDDREEEGEDDSDDDYEDDHQYFLAEDGNHVNLGTSSLIMTGGGALLGQQQQKQQQQQHGGASKSNNNMISSSKDVVPAVPNVTTNWDYDEQYLWKAVGEEKESSFRPYAASHSNNSKRSKRNNRGRSSIRSGKNGAPTNRQHQYEYQIGQRQNRQQQQRGPQHQQQWMYGKNINYHYQDENSTSNSRRQGQLQEGGNIANERSRGRQDYANHSYGSDHAITDANGDSNNNGNNNSNANDFYNSRQHWMPDQLCKECYGCDTQFTVFRRRHHCRLCGQVFCSSCSAFFVPNQNKGNNSTLRTCQMCFEQVTQKGGLLNSNNSDNADGNNTNNNNNKKDEGIVDANNILPTSPVVAVTEAKEDTNVTAIPSEAVTPEGRPIVTDYTTLTIQTSPTALSKKHKMTDAKHLPDTTTATASAATTTTTTTSGTANDIVPPSPAAWLDREQSHEISAQTHWQAAAAAAVASGDNNKATLATENETKGNDPALTKVVSTTKTTTSPTKQSAADAIKTAKRHLGLTAANHLEMMGASLLQKDAPLFLEEIEQHAVKEQQPDATSTTSTQQQQQQLVVKKIQKQWLTKLMTLATRCCATVEPNVKKGDLLDIRPYVKIKVIPGGSLQDSAYLSGIVFRKTVSHKRMAKEIHNPKIMLLSGGIEFTRTENRLASLHTLLEQEDKYMEILVGRILKLKPDVLCVGRSVSRRALELFLKANVVLIQHVKSTLMSRLSRQTGATIISSTDHIMNQFGAHVLGKCNRFRLVTFRDSEVWVDALDHDSDIYNDNSTAKSHQRSIRKILRTPNLGHHERQAALAANILGDSVVDGAEAIKSGLAKRGVATTFVMLEGCPKHLGCTVVLRGASRGALKQAKRVFRFLVNVAYNLRLETCYLKERCARIRPDFQLEAKHIYSSSLCVDYGSPPPGRKMVRPWNGGSNDAQRSLSGEITAFDHQSILITSVWMTEKTQCCPAEVKGICYYSLQDVSLGQFLRDSCFNSSLKCQNPNCKKSVDDHSLLFVHKDGVIKITVEHMDGPLPPPPTSASLNGDGPSKEGKEDDGDDDDADSPIATWTYCKVCSKVITPLVYISENTWKFSFGKFLEVFFYNRDAIMNSSEYNCSCNMQTATLLYFGCGKLAARFSYERVRPLGVFIRKTLPIDVSYHRREALRELENISLSSATLFIKFDKHIEKITRETRSLFNSAANRPEHLQTVLSELNRIGSEVDHAARTLQEKVAAMSDKCRRDGEGVVNEALLCFPWFSRRYLFMLCSAWNERLTATGQAIIAMKKLASSAALRGDSVIGPNGPILGNEELLEAMRRLRRLNEVYSRYNVTDITSVLPTLPGKEGDEDDDDFEDVDASIDFADGVDADVLASRRRFSNSKSTSSGGYAPRGQLHKTLGTQRSFDNNSHLMQESGSNSQPRVTPGGAVKSAITRFFNRGGREVDPYTVDLGRFKEGRPRLEPGVNGIVVPVMDDQLSTVIAYSLASKEYAQQFKNYLRTENHGTELDEAGRAVALRSVDPSTGSQLPSPFNNPRGSLDEKKTIEQRMLVRNKSHIKHTWRDYHPGERGQVTCKFICTSYWATQFQAVRQVFLSSSFGRKEGQTGGASMESQTSSMDVEQGYVQSLSSAFSWAASGGKSGASFARTSDDRFVIKCISRTELQMFLDCAPAYFEYLSKAFFHGLPTVLCKILGVYQIGYHNRETGKRSNEFVAVMQNIFYDRKISKVFDLKGSLRGRFAAHVQSSKEDSTLDSAPRDHGVPSGNTRTHQSDSDSGSRRGERAAGSDRNDAEDTQFARASGTQLDGDFLEFTRGRPMPLNDRAKSLFHMSIQNDTLFLSIINVLDYSILVGIDEEKMELVVGIIDFMRQYDILKQMERVGKSLPMVVGSEAPTIIQPPLYKARFTNAMERYFMTVPCKWTTI